MIEYATYKVWDGCSAPYNLESGGRLIGQRVYSAPSSERTCTPIRRGTIISCGACGSELHEPFRFCGGCGAKVVGE